MSLYKCFTIINREKLLNNFMDNDRNISIIKTKLVYIIRLKNPQIRANSAVFYVQII